ncbi:MAG: hypothetical protein JJU40_13735 [Rhodobacteraceae bacterium]|nr:hypothetical protein [Paracoccaceae bacterium]
MRILLPLFAVGLVAGCSPQIPDSAAHLGTGLLAPPGTISTERRPPAESSAMIVARAPEANVPEAVQAAGGGSSAPVSGVAPLPASIVAAVEGQPATATTPPAPAPDRQADTRLAAALADDGTLRPSVGGGVLGADGDFSDAARIRAEAERAGAIPIEVRPVPSRETRVNVAEFALSTSHPVGERRFRRLALFGQDHANVACRRYASPDDAQSAFLEAGGPERDPLGLDPDGDGFACGWSPEPFRRLAASAG